jgi:hypothetical protein
VKRRPIPTVRRRDPPSASNLARDSKLFARDREKGRDHLARKLAEYARAEAAAELRAERAAKQAAVAKRPKAPPPERKRQIRADGTIPTNLTIEEMRAAEISNETARRIRQHAEYLERCQQKEKLKWHLP